MKAFGVIPARYGSSRFPGKPLADIEGKPMIVRVYERAKLAKTLDGVIVATDDERIINAVKDHGGKAVMTSKDHPNGTQRIAEAVKDVDADLFINIQGDEPLLQPAGVGEDDLRAQLPEVRGEVQPPSADGALAQRKTAVRYRRRPGALSHLWQRAAAALQRGQ